MSSPLESNKINPDLIQDFSVEAEEAIESIDKSIPALKEYVFSGEPKNIMELEDFFRGKPFQTFQVAWNAINRMLHSLKGLSAMIGLGKFSRFCHSLEELTTGISSGSLVFSNDSFTILQYIPGLMTGFLSQIDEDQTDENLDVDPELQKIRQCLDNSKNALRGQTLNFRNLQNVDTGEIRNTQRHVKISIDVEDYDKLVQAFQSFAQSAVHLLDAEGIHSEITQHIRSGLTHHMNELVVASQSNMVLNRYSRMVSDLSRSLGKEAELVIKRNIARARPDVWDKVHLALVHLIRNSLDHGIEYEAIREQKGKPLKGTISIDIYEDHRNTYIHLWDDGAGIDPHKIAYAAMKKGIVDESTLKGLTDQEKQELIFHPGFSTRDQSTQISGRGVGLDAAIEEIKVSLAGQIRLQSTPGEGTLFILEIPKTEVLSECILFGDENFQYGIPLLSKVEYLECKPNYIRKVPGRSPLFTNSEKPFPVLFMMEELHPEQYTQEMGQEATVIKSEDNDGHVMGMIVPRVMGHQLLKIHRSEHLKRIMGDKGFVFGFSLTDPVIVILDPEFLKTHLR